MHNEKHAQTNLPVHTVARKSCKYSDKICTLYGICHGEQINVSEKKNKNGPLTAV